MLVCALFCTLARETSGAARTRYSLRPLIKRVRKFLAKLGRKCAAGPLAHAGIPCRWIAPGNVITLGSFDYWTLAKAGPKGEKSACEEETPAERSIEYQGQGLSRRDLRASNPACSR